MIREELAKFPDAVRDDVIILFSAHSLPMKVGMLFFLVAVNVVGITYCDDLIANR